VWGVSQFGSAPLVDEIEQPKAEQQHILQTLQVWKHAVPISNTAVLPPHTHHPNPLVIGDSVVASVFSPGTICSVDRESGQPRWSYKVDGYAGAQVVHADGRIFAKSSKTLYCLDNADGVPHWSFSPLPQGRETMYSAPTYHRGRVFIGDRAGMFHCLDAPSGKLLWSQKLSTRENNQVNATAAIHDEVVVMGCNAAVIVAYDFGTGQVMWQQSIDGPCISEILAHGDSVFATTGSSIYGLEATTGEIVFHKNWPSLNVRAVALCRGLLVTVLAPPVPASGGEQMTAFEGSSELFQVKGAEFVVGIRFHEKSGLLYESRIGGLGIVDPSTGRRLHNIYRDDDLFNCGLVDIEGDRLYALDMDGAIYCLRSPAAQPGTT
jgi:outer membrane protein assembly factor BamB